MTNLQKSEIVSAIHKEKDRLGSYAKVATKCSVSTATISQMVNENWDLIKPELWLKVANELGYDNSEWQIAETINVKKIFRTCDDAKNKKMFLFISDKAGKGKSGPLRAYWEQNKDNNVFYIQCREWAKREFMQELCTMLGIDYGKSPVTIDKLGMLVIEFFSKRSEKAPQLIIDEIDKLRDPALRWIIHLYNEREDKMSVVAAGSPHLEQRIKRGVKLKKQGYDEIDSRFGRNFLKVFGATENCCENICKTNGITDKTTIKKIFSELKPTTEDVELEPGKFVPVKMVDDLRRLKRITQRELLKLKI